MASSARKQGEAEGVLDLVSDASGVARKQGEADSAEESGENFGVSSGVYGVDMVESDVATRLASNSISSSGVSSDVHGVEISGSDVTTGLALNPDGALCSLGGVSSTVSDSSRVLFSCTGEALCEPALEDKSKAMDCTIFVDLEPEALQQQQQLQASQQGEVKPLRQGEEWKEREDERGEREDERGEKEENQDDYDWGRNRNPRKWFSLGEEGEEGARKATDSDEWKEEDKEQQGIDYDEDDSRWKEGAGRPDEDEDGDIRRRSWWRRHCGEGDDKEEKEEKEWDPRKRFSLGEERKEKEKEWEEEDRRDEGDGDDRRQQRWKKDWRPDEDVTQHNDDDYQELGWMQQQQQQHPEQQWNSVLNGVSRCLQLHRSRGHAWQSCLEHEARHGGARVCSGKCAVYHWCSCEICKPFWEQTCACRSVVTGGMFLQLIFTVSLL